MKKLKASQFIFIYYLKPNVPYLLTKFGKTHFSSVKESLEETKGFIQSQLNNFRDLAALKHTISKKIPLNFFIENRAELFENDKILIMFDQELKKSNEISYFEAILENLLRVKIESNNFHEYIEIFTLVLIEKLMENNSIDSKFKKVCDNLFALIYNNLKYFESETILLYISIISKESMKTKRLFKIFEFLIIRTDFLKSLKDDDLGELAFCTDEYFEILERDSFVEIFEKIEKEIVERKQEFKIKSEYFSRVLFIFSSHSFGNAEFYSLMHQIFKDRYMRLTPEELIIAGWSLINLESVNESKKEVFNKIMVERIQSSMESLDLYHKNLYFYALQTQKKIMKTKINQNT